MITRQLDGREYTAEFRNKVIAYHKKQAKSKVGTTYSKVALKFNIDRVTVSIWVTGGNPRKTVYIRKDGTFICKGVIYAPVK